MAILSVLIEEDLYGSEISNLIKERSGGKFKTSESSIYPALYRMEDKGYISSKKKLVSKRMSRVYYHMEEKGREYYVGLKEEYLEVTGIIMNLLEYQGKEGGK